MHRLALLLGVALIGQGAEKIGQFDTAVDVGEVGLAGSTVFDAKSGVYRVTGAGANIWAGVDAFQYVQNEQVDFLDARRARGGIARYADMYVGFIEQLAHASAVFTGQCDNTHLAFVSGFDRLNDIG